jgi:hypothetical protein
VEICRLKSVKGDLKGNLRAISKRTKKSATFLKSDKISEGILDEKFWGTEEGIRYIGHIC